MMSSHPESERQIQHAVDDCVRYCAGRKKWFLYVIGFAHRLVRRRGIDEIAAAEVTYRARKLLRSRG